MSTAPSLSVCMATYNGERFVGEQVKSIVDQLSADDELIIIDDASTDATVAEIQSLISAAPCRVLQESNDANQGHVATFERALRTATNEILILADQDDVWLPGYADAVRQAFLNRRVGLVLARPLFCDTELNLLDERNKRYAGRHPRRTGLAGVALFLANRAMPIGATMSLRAADLSYMLPFPTQLYAHDHWLFSMAALRHRTTALEVDGLLYRRHSNVASNKRSAVEMVRSRALLVALLLRYGRGR